ncbi:MAG: RDD family protein [Mucilaginibacter sp.]
MELSNTQSYLLVIDGKPEGPFSLAELKERRIKPGDFVRTADMDDYKEAHEIAELRQLLGFAKQPVMPQYFGSFDQRLLASALDWFFVATACTIIIFVISVFVTDRVVRIGLAISLLLVIPVVKLIYHVVMESSAKQATYGKQLLRIRVTDIEGCRIRFGQAAGRNLAKIFSVLSMGIGYLYSFFNKKQQCLHDIIAETLVVKDRLVV